jgi:hypothetical protein
VRPRPDAVRRLRTAAPGGRDVHGRGHVRRQFHVVAELIAGNPPARANQAADGPATGLPPMAYLAQVRAEHAAVLLLHSDEPVTGIGRAVGWLDQNYFARRFKAHYGLSATTYRKRFATEAIHMDDRRLDA